MLISAMSCDSQVRSVTLMLRASMQSCVTANCSKIGKPEVQEMRVSPGPA
jgi:hypothetical protein